MITVIAKANLDKNLSFLPIGAPRRNSRSVTRIENFVVNSELSNCLFFTKERWTENVVKSIFVPNS